MYVCHCAHVFDVIQAHAYIFCTYVCMYINVHALRLYTRTCGHLYTHIYKVQPPADTRQRKAIYTFILVK